MKKALLLIIGIVAIAFLIANAEYFSSFVATLRTGTLLPLIVAIILMFGRHITQAQSYVAAFEAVGHKSTLRHMIILIFSLVFINTFCLFSGATGVVFIVDDARRKGADSGTATSGAFLSQIGYFAAVLIITVIGFITMVITGNINIIFLVGGLLLAAVLMGLSSLFLIGYYKAHWLDKFFSFVQRILKKPLAFLKRRLSDDWSSKQAKSFSQNAKLLAKNPSGTFYTITWALFSALLNMACLVAIGYSFGFTQIAPILAAFALAAVSVIVAPTPQGVGVVEAAIIMILTASGCSVATATAIALVYRGIMFWVPFCFGAILLTQSGFFKDDKNATQEKKDSDTAWIAGVVVGIYGAVNIVIALASSLLQPFMLMAQIADLSQLFPDMSLALAGLIFIVLAFGLVLRIRAAWAATIAFMVIISGLMFLYVGTYVPAFFAAGMTCWLFVKRNVFDKPFEISVIKERISSFTQGTTEDAKTLEGIVQDAEQLSASKQEKRWIRPKKTKYPYSGNEGASFDNTVLDAPSDGGTQRTSTSKGAHSASTSKGAHSVSAIKRARSASEDNVIQSASTSEGAQSASTENTSSPN